MKFFWCWLLLAWLPLAHAANPADLLPVEQAFKLSTTFKDPQTLRAQWDIADGYYLYRKRFDFKTGTAGIELGAAVFPAGKIKNDEFFGEMEIYRHQVVIDIPVTRATNDTSAFNLTTVSQGCADIGVCYPPQTQTVAVTTATADANSSATTENEGSAVKNFFNKLGTKFGISNPENKFLEPDEAYSASFTVQDGRTLSAHWDIADGYYMYRDKFAFRLLNAQGVRLGAPQLPPGESKTDEFLGKTEVYHNQVSFSIPLLRTETKATQITLEATYQGCAEAGFCYPPLTKTVGLSLPAVQKDSTPDKINNAPLVSEQDRLAQVLTGGNTTLALLTFFGLGLLLAFTPCVFPMIPILSSIIVGPNASKDHDLIVTTDGHSTFAQRGTGNTRRAFTLSLVYVLAMALTYTVAGVIAGRFGENLQAASQNPWVLGSFSAVFVLLALSMFGFYQLQIPASWQGKLAALSHRQQGGTLIGVAVMGFLSALIVGPCVAAPLAAALIVIGQMGDPVLGGAALFAMSMGMGAPLLLIGTSLGKWLPSSGAWMDTVKAVFGVLLLAVAIWMLERILPATITLVLWAVLLIISAVYMGALDRLSPEAGGWRKLWKGVGFILIIYGALLLVGAASGGKDVLQPLQGLVAG
ncbi:MAG: protein-disulfide reductase DsbD domain-containing protein, partial [Gammaproteobacteria bacterium]